MGWEEVGVGVARAKVGLGLGLGLGMGVGIGIGIGLGFDKHVGHHGARREGRIGRRASSVTSRAPGARLMGPLLTRWQYVHIRGHATHAALAPGPRSW